MKEIFNCIEKKDKKNIPKEIIFLISKIITEKKYLTTNNFDILDRGEIMMMEKMRRSGGTMIIHTDKKLHFDVIVENYEEAKKLSEIILTYFISFYIKNKQKIDLSFKDTDRYRNVASRTFLKKEKGFNAKVRLDEKGHPYIGHTIPSFSHINVLFTDFELRNIFAVKDIKCHICWNHKKGIEKIKKISKTDNVGFNVLKEHTPSYYKITNNEFNYYFSKMP